MTYEIKIESGHAFDGDFNLKDTWIGNVVFIDADGKEHHAFRAATTWKTDWGKKRCRMKAMNERRKLVKYLEQTGKRWEVEREREAAEKRAKQKAESAVRQRIMKAAPELLEALQELLAEMKSWSDDVAFSPAKIAKAESAIKKATEQETEKTK